MRIERSRCKAVAAGLMTDIGRAIVEGSGDAAASVVVNRRDPNGRAGAARFSQAFPQAELFGVVAGCRSSGKRLPGSCKHQKRFCQEQSKIAYMPPPHAAPLSRPVFHGAACRVAGVQDTDDKLKAMDVLYLAANLALVLVTCQEVNWVAAILFS